MIFDQKDGGICIAGFLSNFV